jgi:hypothetical protein
MAQPSYGAMAINVAETARFFAAPQDERAETRRVKAPPLCCAAKKPPFLVMHEGRHPEIITDSPAADAARLSPDSMIMQYEAFSAAIVHGVLLSAGMTLVVLGSLRHDPLIWRSDLPKEMQKLLGPASPATQRRRRFWALLMAAWITAVTVSLMTSIAASAPLVERTLASYIMFQIFNLYDALVIDIGVILIWAPDWAFPRGLKGHPALRDWRFHVNGYLSGVVIGIPFAILVTAIWAVVATLR